MSDQFDFGQDPEKARKARDEAMKRVGQNAGSWRGNALVALSLLEKGYTGTAEDIRIRLIMKGLEPPHHHNAWGELIRTAIKIGKLIPTGQRKQMKLAKSHARMTPVYRIN